MRKIKTESRLNKITAALEKRQPSLHVVLENIHDLHNVSAIYRTCDAVGVQEVSLLYNVEKSPTIHRESSASAKKWVDSLRFDSTKECFDNLRDKGFKIYASKLAPEAKNMYELDFTERVAIVLGNEHRGISEEVEELADELFYIPMHGMIQSLNVSVANAVTLYEAQRQRWAKGMYDESEYSADELNNQIDDWCNR